MKTLILGATGGIGLDLTRAFNASGEQLFLSGRNPSILRELAQETGAEYSEADLSRELEVKALLEEVGQLDTLIYAAGAVSSSPLSDLESDAAERIWNANYWGAVWTLKHGLPRLAADGKVYLLGAYPELVTVRCMSQYAASKAALAGLAKIAALERKNTVTLVLPPAVNTPLWAGMGGKAPKNALEPDVVAHKILEDALSSAYSAELRI